MKESAVRCFSNNLLPSQVALATRFFLNITKKYKEYCNTEIKYLPDLFLTVYLY